MIIVKQLKNGEYKEVGKYIQPKLSMTDTIEYLKLRLLSGSYIATIKGNDIPFTVSHCKRKGVE